MKLNPDVFDSLLNKICPNVQHHLKEHKTEEYKLKNPANMAKHILGPGFNSRTKNCIMFMRENEERYNTALVYDEIRQTDGIPNTEKGKTMLKNRLFAK